MESHVSVSLVKKVESGVAPASPSFIAGVAAALGVTTSDLTGQPYALAAGSGRPDLLVPNLERAIVEHDNPVIDEPVISVSEAARLLNGIVRDGRLGRYDRAMTVLPSLIRNLHALLACSDRVHSPCPPQDRTYRLLAQTYQSAMFAVYKLGHLSLAAWCAERMESSARLSGDPLWLSMAYYCRAQTLMFTGSYQASEAMLARTLADVEQHNDESAYEVMGASHLSASIIAARLGKRVLSDMHIAEARIIAEHFPTSDMFDTSFSLDNVAIHNVAASVEMNDGSTALARAANITTLDTLCVTRKGHYHIDLARANLIHGNRARVLTELNVARRLAPQQTRYHPQVHEMVYALAVRDLRASESLRNFAAWAGVNI